MALPHVPGALQPTPTGHQGIPDADKAIAFYRQVSTTTAPPGRWGCSSHGAYHGLATHPRGCPAGQAAPAREPTSTRHSALPLEPPLHGLPAPTQGGRPLAPPAAEEPEAAGDHTKPTTPRRPCRALPHCCCGLVRPSLRPKPAPAPRSPQHGLPFLPLLPSRLWPLALLTFPP